MAKRFTDTDIWKKQRWFRKLSPNHKLAFLYIKDQCDHAGIWNIDCTDLIEDLGIETFNIQKFTEDCNTEYDKISGNVTIKERIRLLDKGYLWVTGFIQFQYKGKEGLVNPYAAPVKTAIQILSGFALLEIALNKGFITLTEPFQEGYLTPKEKDKDKDKEDRIGGMGERKEINGKIQKGVKFDENKSFVFFRDGSSQELGEKQRELVESGDLNPEGILKGKQF